MVELKLSGIEELIGLALVDRSTKTESEAKLFLSPTANRVTIEARKASRCRHESEETQPESNSIKLVWQVPEKVTTGKSKKRISKKF